MASPRELVARADAKKASERDAGFKRPPDGWIMVADDRLAVWIPNGETPQSMGLKSFIPNPAHARWRRDQAA